LIGGEIDTVEAPVVSGIAFNRDEAEITVYGLPDEPGTAYRVLRAVSEANIEIDMIVLHAPRDGKIDLSFTVHRDDYATARRLVEAAHSGIPGTSLAGSDRVAKLSVVAWACARMPVWRPNYSKLSLKTMSMCGWCRRLRSRFPC
jgi:aspartate kinase